MNFEQRLQQQIGSLTITVLQLQAENDKLNQELKSCYARIADKQDIEPVNATEGKTNGIK